MSLYIRVQTSFWTHRKTMRLRARIGDAALWVPPCLWSYAAGCQPDGDFNDYTASELALCLGYPSDGAQAMLQALQDVGFMDGMRIHDWHEHNAYHEKFAVRAKKAAAARWGKEKKGKDKKGKERSQALLEESTSNASSISTAGFVVPECFAQVDGFTLALAGWIESRKKKRNPPTAHAIQLMVNRLAEQPQRAIAALSEATLCGWSGFKWEWLDNAERKNGTRVKPVNTAPLGTKSNPFL